MLETEIFERKSMCQDLAILISGLTFHNHTI